MTTPVTNTSSHPPLWRWTLSQFQGTARPVCQGGVSRIHPAFPAWRSRSRPLQALLQWKGGPEGEVVLDSRGWRFVFPAHVPIIDVLNTLNGIPPKRQ